MGEYLTGWLAGKQSLRTSTVVAYAGHVRLYLIPHLGDIALVDLRPEHIEVMYREILEQNIGRDRPVGPATLARVHATLMSAMGTAVRRGLISRNPAETVELPTPRRHRVSVWTAEQLAAFLGSVIDDDLYPLLVLLALCGLRRGEALGLRWMDVDLHTGCLWVRRQLVAVDGDIVVGEPKSKSGHRMIALDKATVRLLQCHRSAQRQQLAAAGAEPMETDLVFTQHSGSALDPTYVSRRFDRLVLRSGLPRIRLHDLRHTSASLGLASGETMLEVSRRLGHSSIAITADIYSHVSPEVARESAERLSRFIFGN